MYLIGNLSFSIDVLEELSAKKWNRVMDIFHLWGWGVAELHSLLGCFPPIKSVLGMTNLTTKQQI